MQSENTINIDWKNRLEDASLLPDDTLPHKDIAWQKLHGRLHGKQRPKRVIAYWAAAACILFALVTPFIHLPKNQNNIVKSTTRKAPEKNETQILKPATKEIAATIVTPVFVGKKNAVFTTIAQNKTNAVVSDSIKNVSAPANEVIATKKDEVLPALNNDSSATKTLALIPIKKKLKVVHINELGDPIEEPADLASSAEQHLLPWKLGNAEVFSNPLLAYRKTAFPLIKTKPSTSN